MITEKAHISVCICSFKRPTLLKRLLDELEHQNTDGLFTYSAVVVDNDRAQTARQTTLDFASHSTFRIRYCVVPKKNIALARNKAVEKAWGDYIAFIDDDEHPTHNWLNALYKTCTASVAAGVLGPVEPYFEEKPPKWALKGKFFERPRHETGYAIGLAEARTGNTLLRKQIFEGQKTPFKSKFSDGGEDIDFFRRMMQQGHTFLWCDEAVVYESVPPMRCTRSYLLRRALFRGKNFFKHKDGHARGLIKSLLAIPAYALALPFLLIAGEQYFLKIMIKFCDHAGRLLALVNLNPIRERDP